MIILTSATIIPKDKNLTLFCCSESSTVWMHAHDFYEFVYVYEGVGKHYLSNSSTQLKQGDFLILSPGAEHCVCSLESEDVPTIKICNLLIVRDYFDKMIASCFDSVKDTNFMKVIESKAPFCLQIPDNDEHTIKNLIWTMKYEYNMGQHCADCVIENLIRLFLFEAARLYDFQTGRVEPPGKNTEIQNLINYIKSNLNHKLTLNSLASQIHLSPEYLSRQFKKTVGKNVSVYIMEQRIEKAKMLLISTNYSISDICFLCGYSSDANFRKYFGKIVGMSPREYRKLCTSNIQFHLQ